MNTSPQSSPSENLQFVLGHLEQIENEIKNNSNSNYFYYNRTNNNSVWAQLGKMFLEEKIQELPADQVDTVKNKIISILGAIKGQPYNLHVFCLDDLLSISISITQKVPSQEELKMLLNRECWSSIEETVKIDNQLRSFPWDELWKSRIKNEMSGLSSDVFKSVSLKKDKTLSQVDDLLAQKHLIKDFLPFIPLHRLQNLIKNEKLDSEVLLNEAEYNCLTLSYPTARYLVEECIRLWEVKDPQQTPHRVSKWMKNPSSTFRSPAQSIPTAYCAENGTPYEGWHCSLLSRWHLLMDYKGGDKICPDHQCFINKSIIQGELIDLANYMHMAQQRPSKRLLKNIDGNSFWNSAMILQALNTNEYSQNCFWVSASSPYFFNQLSPDIQEQIKKEVERLALSEGTPSTTLMNFLVPGAYQRIVYKEKIENTSQAENLWSFFKKFPKQENQDFVVKKITRAVLDGYLTIDDSEVEDVLEKSNVSEQTKLALSTASRARKSGQRNKAKM